jgi:hypothetical protein
MPIDKALMVRAQDGEQLLKQSMFELLTLPAACSLVALTPAHSSRLLPSAICSLLPEQVEPTKEQDVIGVAFARG